MMRVSVSEFHLFNDAITTEEDEYRQ